MRPLINIRHLERKSVPLQGELTAAELDLENLDELIHVSDSLNYDLEAEKVDQAILVQGRLSLMLECECARCLRPFQHELELPDWACHLPLDGPDRVDVVNDVVDLTPFIREDILLEFPQHPLCGTNCKGLPARKPGRVKQSSGASPSSEVSSPWSELNKLKF
jgi:uncharacterized protein